MAGQGAYDALTDRVVVLRNTSSPISRAVAEDYAARRGVHNIVDIACQDASVNSDLESMNYTDYLSQIEAPLRRFLESHPSVDFIVLTKGIPIRIYGSQDQPVSVDGYLAALDYGKLPGSKRIILKDVGWDPNWTGAAWSNRFWNSKARFSHSRFGGYMVSRLDGYTQADAIALTTRSLLAESLSMAAGKPKGRIVLDEDPYRGTTSTASQPFDLLRSNPASRDTIRIKSDMSFGDYNSDMALAADSLAAAKNPFLLETTNSFLGGKTGLMGYVSWGSNDSHFDMDAYHSLGFAPGSIGETAVSTGGRTFLPTSGGQSLVADLIQQGIACIKGYVNEPFLVAIASPSILFSRYTSGWTMAESFFAASRMVGWEDLVLGDPLCRAYPSQEPMGSLAFKAGKQGRERVFPSAYGGRASFPEPKHPLGPIFDFENQNKTVTAQGRLVNPRHRKNLE